MESMMHQHPHIYTYTYINVDCRFISGQFQQMIGSGIQKKQLRVNEILPMTTLIDVLFVR